LNAIFSFRTSCSPEASREPAVGSCRSHPPLVPKGKSSPFGSTRAPYLFPLLVKAPSVNSSCHVATVISSARLIWNLPFRHVDPYGLMFLPISSHSFSLVPLPQFTLWFFLAASRNVAFSATLTATLLFCALGSDFSSLTTFFFFDYIVRDPGRWSSSRHDFFTGTGQHFQCTPLKVLSSQVKIPMVEFSHLPFDFTFGLRIDSRSSCLSRDHCCLWALVRFSPLRARPSNSDLIDQRFTLFERSFSLLWTAPRELSPNFPQVEHWGYLAV